MTGETKRTLTHYDFYVHLQKEGKIKYLYYLLFEVIH